MDVEAAEKQLKSMAHSEQHYFNRLVCAHPALHKIQSYILHPTAMYGCYPHARYDKTRTFNLECWLTSVAQQLQSPWYAFISIAILDADQDGFD